MEVNATTARNLKGQSEKKRHGSGASLIMNDKAIKHITIKNGVTIAILIIVLSSLSVFLFFGRGIVHENSNNAAPIVFRLAETQPSDHPSAKAAAYFAQLVDERSGGRIKIKVYYGGELGTPEEIIEQVQFGGIPMARVNALDLTESVESLGFFLSPKNGKTSDELMEWFVENDELLHDSFRREHMEPLVWYYPDIRCFYSDEEIFLKLSDLEGMKIKTTASDIMSQSMAAIGCSAVDTITADTYKSMTSGYIDAGETTLSEFVLSDYYRFINHVTLSRYLNLPDVMLVNSGAYTMLEKSDRELINQCAADTYGYQKKLLKEFQNKWILELKQEKSLFLEDEDFIADMKEAISSSGEVK